MKRIWGTGALVLVVSGCVSGTSNPIVSTSNAPPSASSGYATSGDDVFDPAVTLSTTANLQSYDPVSGAVSQGDITITTSPTGTSDDFVLTHNGVSVTLTWDATNSRYSGTSGNLEYRAYIDWSSDKYQLEYIWVNIIDSGTGPSSWGATAYGFNTDPAEVAARTGTATYSGLGVVYISADDDSFYTAATGPVTLTADFDADTIGGSMSVTQCLTCSQGSAPSIASDTVVTINPTNITDNTFTTTAAVSAADLGLASVGTIGVDGMFYEDGATGVGGQLVGSGTPIVGPATALINGAFAADE